MDRSGVAGCSEFTEGGPTGVTEAEELSPFIEGFTGSIVEGFTEKVVLPILNDPEEEGVTAADDKGDVLGDGVAAKEWGKQMSLDVIDGEERLIGADGKAFCKSHTDEEGWS